MRIKTEYGSFGIEDGVLEYFDKKPGVTDVVIPASVRSIRPDAFQRMFLADIIHNELTSVVLPPEVTCIESGTFSGCVGLESVTIPPGVTSIGDNAFRGCESLVSIAIPSAVTSIGNGAFAHCESLAAVTIPSSVTSIGDNAFRYCRSLVSVAIPSGVTSIGDGAFSDCSSLASVTIPSGVASIGDNAFRYCRSLVSVAIPSGVTSIGDGAFSDCSSLASVTIPSGVANIGKDVFHWCSSLASVIIPPGVTSIGDGAFSDCSSLASVTIPPDVTDIGQDAFSGTPWLKQKLRENPLVIVSQCLIAADSEALDGEIVIPEGVTCIEPQVFDSCEGISSAIIPPGVTRIGYAAFRDCRNLATVTISPGVTYIGPDAFAGTPWLKQKLRENPLVIVSQCLIAADSEALDGEIVIPEGVTSIAVGAFDSANQRSNYRRTISVTVPESLTRFDPYTFPYFVKEITLTISAEQKTPSEFAKLFGSRSFLKKIHFRGIGTFETTEESMECADIAAVYDAFFTGEIATTFSSTAIKYDLLISMIRSGCHVEEARAKAKPSALRILEYCVEKRSPEDVTALFEAGGLITKRNADKVWALVKDRNFAPDVKARMREQIERIKSGGTVPAPRTSAQPETAAVQSDGDLVIEKGTLKAVGAKYKELILPEGITAIAKNVFADAKVKKLVLPGTLKKISGECFRSANGINEVVISQGTESIGAKAFYTCKNLKSVLIPDSVKTIGDKAFKGCEKLASVTVGSGLERLDAGMFDECKKLAEFVISPENPVLASYENGVYNKALTTLIFLPYPLRTWVFPGTLKTVENIEIHRVNEIILDAGESLRGADDTFAFGSGTTFTSRIKVIRLRAGEKECAVDFANIVYVMDFHEQNTGYDEIIMHLSKPTLRKLLEYTLNFLLTGNFDPKYGMIEYTSRAYGAHTDSQYYPLLDSKLHIVEGLADIYGMDKEQMEREVVAKTRQNIGKLFGGDEDAVTENLAAADEEMYEVLSWDQDYLPSLFGNPDAGRGVMKRIIEHEDLELLRKLLETDARPGKEDVLSWIDCVNEYASKESEHKGTAVEAQVMLMNYQNQHFGAATVDERFNLQS